MKPGRRPDSARGSVSPGGGVGPPASDGLEVFFMRPFLNRASAPRKRLRGAKEDALGTQGGGCPPEQRLPAWLWYFLCYPATLQKPCQVEVRGNKAGRGPAGPQKRTCRHHAGGPCSLIAAGPSGRNDPRRVNVFLLDRPRNGLPPSSQGRSRVELPKLRRTPIIMGKLWESLAAPVPNSHPWVRRAPGSDLSPSRPVFLLFGTFFAVGKSTGVPLEPRPRHSSEELTAWITLAQKWRHPGLRPQTTPLPPLLRILQTQQALTRFQPTRSECQRKSA